MGHLVGAVGEGCRRLNGPMRVLHTRMARIYVTLLESFLIPNLKGLLKFLMHSSGVGEMLATTGG